jgi:hypothetical protein
MRKELENTYWNKKGKLQSVYDELVKLIPFKGKCPKEQPALERLRVAAIFYYDLYNNGMCNHLIRDFRASFGCAHSEVDLIERKLDSLILEAALESGYKLTK